MKSEEAERSETAWQASLLSELDSLAGLTAIDGATIISDQFELSALLASQDGLFTIFTWFPGKKMVQAYRRI